MRKHILDLEVVSVESLSDKHVLVKLTHEHSLPEMLPGQFVEVKVDNSPTTFLRRPISINFVDHAANQLWLLVAVVGDGTHAIAHLKPGDRLNCILPLGNGFTLPENAQQRYLLVGGGVGMAPMLYLGSEIKRMGGVPTFLLGGRSAKDILMKDSFERMGRVCITTEDGTLGEKGFVTQHSVLQRELFDRICCCGPKPMMVSMARYASKVGVDCEVSLENKMACGLGACLCCVEKTTKGNVCTCKEGPVFNINQLLWQA